MEYFLVIATEMSFSDDHESDWVFSDETDWDYINKPNWDSFDDESDWEFTKYTKLRRFIKSGRCVGKKFKSVHKPCCRKHNWRRY